MTRAILSSRRAISRLAVWMISLGAALSVLAVALFLQWFIYTDWMHRNGQLRIVGAVLAAVVTWIVVMRWQQAARRRQLELLQRFETIRWMNDRIRNALQSIDLLAFTHSKAAEQVRASVDTIAAVLSEVQHQTGNPPSPATATAGKKPAQSVELTEEAQSTLSGRSARS